MRGKKSEYPLRMVNGEPEIIQYVINGLTISWNPDDNHFYINKGDCHIARHNAANKRAWGNVLYICLHKFGK